MRFYASKGAFRLRRSLRLVTLGSTALLVIAALACGTADQPREPSQPSTQASQVEPAQPVTEPTTSETAPMEQATGERAKAEESIPAVMDSSKGPEPAMAKEMTAEPESAPKTMTEQPAQTQPEPVVKAVAPPAEPSVEITEPTPASHEAVEPAAPSPNETAGAAAVEVSPQLTVAPQPAVAPQPTAVPQATQVPAPVVAEPVPETGNQVGNRVPDFTLDLVGGATISTASLIEEGRPTFLFFTSTT